MNTFCACRIWRWDRLTAGGANSTQQIGSRAGGAEGSLCRKGSGWLVGTLDKSRRKLQRGKVQPEREGDGVEVDV